MEPNNIENQIREKLNSREIQPSAQAWDRLDAMLTVAEEKKTKRSFFSFKYIGIAASVLVFVTLGLFFFNQKNTTIESQNTVVETERKETPNSNIQTPNLESRQIEEVAVSVKKEDYSQQTTDNRQQITNNNEVSIINQNQEEAIVNQEIVSPKQEEKIIKKTSMVDVDELLASVEKDRKKETKVSKSSINIDAKSLLSEVDTELDMTFRQRVLNTVNKNYKSVKEAVVNRNH
ncbi:hypothetical protein [Flavobacterium macrobrachii]|uniref:Anti-sigma factor n=1 Tax=Flavobacterium macrobrachii TaxID=591204 RepID=A0ABS2CXL5_9FLAO|nr:hypothetical protein [Flavobacterium macrobrachii]MBM6499644.1 hypothetical protein [Flavobacterium macrobrachii]